MGKRKNNDRLHPPTGDPFDKAEGALDKINMPSMGNMGKTNKKMDDGYNNPFESKKNVGFGSMKGAGMGFDDVKGMGFGDFGEKQTAKKTKKGKGKKTEKKPFDMFGGLQGDDGKGFGFGNDGKGIGY